MAALKRADLLQNRCRPIINIINHQAGRSCCIAGMSSDARLDAGRSMKWRIIARSFHARRAFRSRDIGRHSRRFMRIDGLFVASASRLSSPSAIANYLPVSAQIMACWRHYRRRDGSQFMRSAAIIDERVSHSMRVPWPIAISCARM